MSTVECPPNSTAEQLLQRVLSLLDDATVAVAVLRSPGRDGRGVLEADLLVDPAHRVRAEAVLVADGFRRRPGWGRDPHRFFLRPLPCPAADGSVDWLKLDLVTDLCFGPRHQWVTRLGAECLRDRRPGPQPRLAPADELVAHTLHALVDRGGLRAKDLAALSTLAGHVDGGGRLALALTEPGVGPASFTGLVAAARDGRWDAVRSAGPALRRRVAARHRVRGAARTVASLVLRRSTRLLRPLAGRGPLVALVGPDGTGKSTLVAGLVDSAGVPCRALYGGTYRSGTSSSVPGVTTARVVSRLLATRMAIAWHRTWGRLVVLDRHPVQARPVRGDELRPLSRLRRHAVAATLPPPDLIVVLDAPAELLHARRPEHSVARLERDRARHVSLPGPSPTVVVDASQAPEAVRARALALIWQLAVPAGVRLPVAGVPAA